MAKNRSTTKTSERFERGTRGFEKNVATSVTAALATQPEGDTRPPLLLAQDEGRFGRISRPRACWATPGVRPEGPAQRIRASLYAFAAVAPSLGKICALLLPNAETESMHIFFQEVSSLFSHSFLVMQVDGAGWHHAKNLVVPENRRLIKQPPYSPE